MFDLTLFSDKLDTETKETLKEILDYNEEITAWAKNLKGKEKEIKNTEWEQNLSPKQKVNS